MQGKRSPVELSAAKQAGREMFSKLLFFHKNKISELEEYVNYTFGKEKLEMSDMVKYRTALWSFLKLDLLMIYGSWRFHKRFFFFKNLSRKICRKKEKNTVKKNEKF